VGISHKDPWGEKADLDIDCVNIFECLCNKIVLVAA